LTSEKISSIPEITILGLKKNKTKHKNAKRQLAALFLSCMEIQNMMCPSGYFSF